jgi:hypothetical protein
VTFELVTEFEEMQKWDAMLSSMDVLDKEPKQYPLMYVGTFISTYGVPGANGGGHQPCGQRVRLCFPGVVGRCCSVSALLAVQCVPAARLLQPLT